MKDGSQYSVVSAQNYKTRRVKNILNKKNTFSKDIIDVFIHYYQIRILPGDTEGNVWRVIMRICISAIKPQMIN